MPPFDLAECIDQDQSHFSLDDKSGFEVLPLPSKATSRAEATDQIVRFNGSSLIKTANETGGNLVNGEMNQNVIKLPSLRPGIVLSLVMAISSIIGTSGPLHAIYAASGFKEFPWEASVPGSPFFLDVYFVFLPIVVLNWTFCLFRLSDAFTYESSQSRWFNRAAILLMSLVFNPVAYLTLFVALMAALCRFVSGPFDLLFALTVVGLSMSPIFTTYWFYRLIRKITNLSATSPSGSFLKKRFPALAIAMCHLVPLLAFGCAAVCSISVILIARGAYANKEMPPDVLPDVHAVIFFEILFWIPFASSNWSSYIIFGLGLVLETDRHSEASCIQRFDSEYTKEERPVKDSYSLFVLDDVCSWIFAYVSCRLSL